jgi:hypothetical protein
LGVIQSAQRFITKIEAHVGHVGANFSIESLTDVTIYDDKLRHSSKTFVDHGFKRTGFRGSRCGPVMNAAGADQTGLILSIYFSRFGDADLSTVKSLLRYLAYGEEPHLKQGLDVILQMDRGYNIASVTRLRLKLRCQLLGTHSEKVGKGPYCTSGTPREWQQPVPVDGAGTSLFSKRKQSASLSVTVTETKRIGMFHTTFPLPRIWDLITSGSLTDSPAIAFKASTSEMQ